MKILRFKLIALLVFSTLAVNIAAQTVPTPTPSPTPAQLAPKQSEAQLRSMIAMALANPAVRRGQVGVKIVSATTGKTIYERNADNYFMPASNMKSYTVATAIDRLTPEFRFKTSVYAAAAPDSNGVIAGDLIIFGRGDPSFSEAFSEGNPYFKFDELADAIVRAGIKQIDGSLIGDESYFNTNSIPNGWEWDDLQWYYGAEVSALSSFDNAVEIKVLPAGVGNQANVTVSPFNSLVKIVNNTMTGSNSEKRTFRVTKLLGQNVVELSGNVPQNNRGWSGRVAISDPAAFFANILAQRLRIKGVTIRGVSKSIDSVGRNGIEFPNQLHQEIASVHSAPLSEIAPKIMKPSQNLYTEMLLRALGENTANPSDKDTASDDKGMKQVRDLLSRAGAESGSIVQYDGSGLSRHNLITPDSAVKLFQYMDRNRYSRFWRESLTIGGVDGTLRRRFKGTAAQGNVRGKTGTLDQVSALSGYVTSKSGERFVFSILTNFIPSSALRSRTIDNIVVDLANFDGVIEP